MGIAILISVSNIVCFTIGAIVGQKVVRQQPIVKSPVQVIQEHKEKEIVKEENDKYKTILENIDMYDGTSIGQKEIGG